GGLAIAAEHQPATPAEPVEHPTGEAADDLEPFGIDIEEDQLVDRQALVPTGEPLDELRRIGAATADDGDLDAHCVPSVGGLDTNAYNVISNSHMRKTTEPHNSSRR